MSSWDEAFDDKASGGSDKKKVEFAKFPEGITRFRILDAAPNVRWTHWMPQFKRSANCPGRGCPICALRKSAKDAGETSKYNVAKRWAINIFNHDTKRVEVMEQGKQFFEELRDFNAEKGDIRTFDVQVKRKGKGKDDTSYRLDALDTSDFTQEAFDKALEDATDLNDYFKVHTTEQILRLLAGEAWDDVMKSDYAEDSAGESEEEIELK